ncbi:hypothetical protein [Coleofasciculus sp. F4-SAH-05]|uniref:hypothetical protein n=1 Tax=Coleofasciculus sp. F4-SAH-05 TaxID=3069525 RepID=UPI0032F6FC97
MKQLPLRLLSSSLLATSITLMSGFVSANAVQASAISFDNTTTSINTLTHDASAQVNEANRRLPISTMPHIPEHNPNHDDSPTSQPTMLISFALIVGSIAATAARYRQSC